MAFDGVCTFPLRIFIGDTVSEAIARQESINGLLEHPVQNPTGGLENTTEEDFQQMCDYATAVLLRKHIDGYIVVYGVEGR